MERETKRKPGRPRKADAKQVLAVRLAPEVIRYLNRVDSKAAVVEEAIRKSKAFREFKYVDVI